LQERLLRESQLQDGEEERIWHIYNEGDGASVRNSLDTFRPEDFDYH